MIFPTCRILTCSLCPTSYPSDRRNQGDLGKNGRGSPSPCSPAAVDTEGIRGLHYVKRQPTGRLPAHACAPVCACGSVAGAPAAPPVDQSHKERGGGSAEAEPWQEPQQHARQLRQGALGAREEPQGSEMVQEVSTLPPHRWPTLALPPPHASAWMNEFLAAPCCTPVPNGYQVSVTLLFLLQISSSPLGVSMCSLRMRVHAGACMHLCMWKTEPKGCACCAQLRFDEQIYRLRHTLSRQIKSGVHVGCCCCCSFLFGGLESRQRDIMLQRCFVSFPFPSPIPFCLVLPHARALPLLQRNC